MVRQSADDADFGDRHRRDFSWAGGGDVKPRSDRFHKLAYRVSTSLAAQSITQATTTLAALTRRGMSQTEELMYTAQFTQTLVFFL
ncbi:hypothetical protein BG74_03785 [Sodalis-like endosymbiont of Proechinophthirus fluctus]|nr:hypothetical protein BG74_03785 [Sodalis-like endosymbiont of Proechinophthirus fluctus]